MHEMNTPRSCRHQPERPNRVSGTLSRSLLEACDVLQSAAFQPERACRAASSFMHGSYAELASRTELLGENIGKLIVALESIRERA
jgi:hypothetical protein